MCAEECITAVPHRLYRPMQYSISVELHFTQTRLVLRDFQIFLKSHIHCRISIHDAKEGEICRSNDGCKIRYDEERIHSWSYCHGCESESDSFHLSNDH
jgi:hypothetical protein